MTMESAVTIGFILGYSITCLEIAVIAVCLWRRIATLLPIFFSYVAWTVLSDMIMIMARNNPSRYFQVFRFEMPIDSVLQFGVLVELAWSVLRPMRSALPRRVLVIISLMFIVVGAIVWPFTNLAVRHNLPPDWTLLLRLEQVFSGLRILFFLGLVALSQFLAITWKDRELQVATGLAFYSIASLGAAILHTHPASPVQFHWIDNGVSASYLLSLVYWGLSFLQKEAPRQEFSPRMQSILLTVAGGARANRIALDDLRKGTRR